MASKEQSSLYESNIKLLRQRFASLAERIDSYMGEMPHTEYTPQGLPVPACVIGERRVFVHSKYDPRKEAERLAAESGAGKANLIIVSGFGYGYHVRALRDELKPESTLLVVEHSLGLLRGALESTDLGDILADPRIILLHDPDDGELGDLLRGKSSYKVVFVTHRGCHQLDPSFYQNAQRAIKTWLSTKDVNIATLAKFEKLWQANIARNAKVIAQGMPASSFYGRFAGVPAVVVAAGPSLPESEAFLRQAAEKALIVAVDTSFLLLRRMGIEPHFCLCVDPQVINARYFEECPSSRTVLIADPVVHPSVFRLYKGPVAVCGIAFDGMKWIEQICGEKGEITHGGSVSTNAYDFARRCGCSPIYLAGQDLAFSKGLAHAKGSYLDELVHLRTNRFTPAPVFNRRQLRALPPIRIPAVDGGVVETNQKLRIFQNWFEGRKDPALVNAGLHGAYLQGMPNVSIHELHIDKGAPDLDEQICSLIEGWLVSGNDSSAALATKVRVIINELQVMERKLGRAVTLSEELAALQESPKAGRRIQVVLDELQAVDQYVSSRSGVADIVGLTVQRVIHTITEGYELEENQAVDDPRSAARRSLYLYRGLHEGTVYTKKVLDKMYKML